MFEVNQSINKLYLPSNLQCSTQVLISSSQHFEVTILLQNIKKFLQLAQLLREHGQSIFFALFCCCCFFFGGGGYLWSVYAA